ncbi:FAD-dependent monooxygenase [Oxalobacteraceae bacterium R-40]|uniref:FAD-dependent monooxygenase n=1 Tax=Keguizhuia sedimenti TaxID=3064264 RepID=A0ABU1BQ38_9BURK|nr:FAD-dependent monooxygenase [Oxalobacteraceae bacterium R-40]
MNSHCDVCVVGNGAIGKVTALGLAQAGVKTNLLVPFSGSQNSISPSRTADWDVRVYALNQIARDLLAAIKVWDAMDATRIAPVDAMIVNGDGKSRSGKLTFDAYGARVKELAWIVEDANLNQALDAALKFAPNLHIVAGKAVKLSSDSDRATIELESGSQIHASLVVGADGGQSWVRGQCGIGIDYRPYHQKAIVTNFSCEKPHHGAAWQWFTSHSGIIALLPLPGQRISLVWSAPENLAETLMQESLDGLARRIEELPGQPFGRLTPLQPEVKKSFPLALIRPHAITASRVALVGDAAHVVHPLAGHGMNLGFADVNALLQLINEHGPSGDYGDDRLLGRYARARKEDILLMQLATDGLERLFATELEPVSFLRNAGLNLIDKFPFIKRRLISHALRGAN